MKMYSYTNFSHHNLITSNKFVNYMKIYLYANFSHHNLITSNVEYFHCHDTHSHISTSTNTPPTYAHELYNGNN